MTFTVTQKKEAYKKLPTEIQSFVMDNETTELIDVFLSEVNLSEDQSISADGEILYAMLGLQTLTDAIKNIAESSNKNTNDLSVLKTNLEKNIFSKIQNGESLPALEYNKHKIIEIGEKYSLDEEKTNKLIDFLGQPSIKTKKQEDLIEVLTLELGISTLLAEQIVGDLKKRVLEYPPKTSKNHEGRGGGDIPELRPQITPLVEPQEKVRVRPVPVGFTDASPKPIPKPQMPVPELVQRPISVPRYTAVPMEEDNSSQQLVASSKETPKPNEVTPSQPASSPQPVPEPVKKYAVDPYREPLD